MKYVVIIPDGAADLPQDCLQGKTALGAAMIPGMDRIAQSGIVGQVNFVPKGFPVGSDVALMSLLGLDPNEHYCGRAALEASAQGIELTSEQCAIRCNLVTVNNGRLESTTAGSISSDEASQLIAFANEKIADEKLGEGEFNLVSGAGYRNLLIASGKFGAGLTSDTRMLSPNDLIGQSVLDAFPRGPRSETLCQIMDRSVAWFADHPVNQRRIQNGLPAATCLWFWGAGRNAPLSSFADQFGKSACMISAVDLVHGLARMRGISRIAVPTATEMPDTDYAAKGAAACNELEHTDVVFVHIEAPDEAAHNRDAHQKVKSLESIDKEIIQPILQRLQQESQWRILVCPDHITCSSDGKHHAGSVCFAAAGSGIAADDAQQYDEATAAQSSLRYNDGHQLLPWLLGY